MTGKKKVFILGASGSIGKSTLDIVRKFPQYFELAGFSYHSDSDFAEKLKLEFPSAFLFCTKNYENSPNLNTSCGFNGDELKKYEEVLSETLEKSGAEIAVNGISGIAGLKASLCVLKNGKDLALANKESIVTAGKIIANLAEKNGANIIPVDSEHWAVFQLINSFGGNGKTIEKKRIAKIILTASGGAFKNLSSEELKNVKLEDALFHPTWSMGAKITIDSASLANKALEVIEAVNLFGVAAHDITVTVHKQSIVHSMIQLKNGEIYAQLSPPDMRNPIFGALTFPETAPPYLAPLDFSESFSLDFEKPRDKDFPLLRLGFEAAEKQGAYPIAFNAADEEAVKAFMQKRIRFTDMARVAEETLFFDWGKEAQNINEVFITDKKARDEAKKIITKIQTKC